jgi:hypothetical protein
MYVEVESAGEKECGGKGTRMRKKWLANVLAAPELYVGVRP